MKLKITLKKKKILSYNFNKFQTNMNNYVMNMSCIKVKFNSILMKFILMI